MSDLISENPPNIWDQIAKNYDEREGDSGDEFRKKLYDPVIEQLLGNIYGQTVADLGCGNGYWSKKLVELGASNVIAVDGSTQLVDIAKIRANGLPIEFHVSDLSTDTFPIADGSCDVLLSNMVLDYVRDISNFGSEAARTLKENGRLIFGIQNPSYHIAQAAIHRSPDYDDEICYEGENAIIRKKTFEGQVVMPIYFRQFGKYLDVMVKNGLQLSGFKEIENLTNNEQRGIPPREVLFRQKDGSGYDAICGDVPRVIIAEFTKHSRTPDPTSNQV